MQTFNYYLVPGICLCQHFLISLDNSLVVMTRIFHSIEDSVVMAKMLHSLVMKLRHDTLMGRNSLTCCLWTETETQTNTRIHRSVVVEVPQSPIEFMGNLGMSKYKFG